MELHRQRSFDVADLHRTPPPPPLVSQLSLQSAGGGKSSSSSKKKQLALKIVLLDDTVTIIQAQAKATGRVVFEQICKQLNVLEADYFGLEYLNQDSTTGPMYFWLDLEKRLSHQVGLSMTDPVLRFSVKFYTPDPSQLEEEFTRYLFSLQIRKDLASGQLMCNDNTASLMASYLVQAECGDFNEEDYPDASYLKRNLFVPNQDDSIEYRIRENHKKHLGQSPGEADLHLLETARRTEFYGIRMYPAKDDDGVLLNVAVCHMGVLVFQNYTKINTFSWGKIRKLSFKRKKFILKLHPEGFGYYKEVVEFTFGHRNECKAFWKCCVEHHSFFRCDNVQPLNDQDQHRRRSKSLLSSRGSSFRYSGRTQKQMVSFVRENFIKRSIGGGPTSSVSSSAQATPNSLFQRSSSFRSGTTTTPVQTHHPPQAVHSHAHVHHAQHSGVSTSCSSPAVIERHQEGMGGSPSTDDSFSPGTSINSSPQQQPSQPQLYQNDNHQQGNNSANQTHRSVSSLLLYSEKEFPVTTYRTRRQSTDETKSNASSNSNVSRRRRKLISSSTNVPPIAPMKPCSKSLAGLRSKTMDPRYSSDYDNEEDDVENIIHISGAKRTIGSKSKPKYYSDDEEEEEDYDEDDNEEERQIVRSRVNFRRRSGSYISNVNTLPRNNNGGSLGDSICGSSKYKSKEDTTSHGSYDLLDADSVPYLLRRRIEIEKHDPLMKSKSFGGHCKKSLKRSKVFRFASFNHLLWNYSWRDDTIDWDQEQIFGVNPPPYWDDQDQGSGEIVKKEGRFKYGNISDEEDECEGDENKNPNIQVDEVDDDDISSEGGKEMLDEDNTRDNLVLEPAGEEWLPIRRMSMCSNIVLEGEEEPIEEEAEASESDSTRSRMDEIEVKEAKDYEIAHEDDTIQEGGETALEEAEEEFPKETPEVPDDQDVSDDEAQMQEQPAGGSVSGEEESLKDEVAEQNLGALPEQQELAGNKDLAKPPVIDNAKSRFISQEGTDSFISQTIEQELVDDLPMEEEEEVYYVQDDDIPDEDDVADDEPEEAVEDDIVQYDEVPAERDNQITPIVEEEEEPLGEVTPSQRFPIFFENTLARTSIFPERSTAQLATLVEEDQSKEDDEEDEPETKPTPAVVTFLPRLSQRKSSTASLDDLPLPPLPTPIEEVDEYEYIDCETPKYPPPPDTAGGNSFDFRRSVSSESASSQQAGPSTSTSGEVKRKLQLQRTFSIEQPDLTPSPPVPPRRSSSGCTETIEECSSDNENSSSPEIPPMFLNFPRTLSRISERTHSSESSFMEKIESRLKEKRALRVASADEDSTTTMSLNNVQPRAPLVTLTSELGDSSATLNDLEEIGEEENGNSGEGHGHGSGGGGGGGGSGGGDGSEGGRRGREGPQQPLHRVTLSLNVVEGKIVFH